MDGPSSFLSKTFPIALNGATGACKAGIDVYEWACRQAHQCMQKLASMLMNGPVVFFKNVSDSLHKSASASEESAND